MYNVWMPEEKEPTSYTKLLRIGWKDIVFACLVPGLLIGGLFGWGGFMDYYDEPGRNIWPWIVGALQVTVYMGAIAGAVILFFTLIVKEIIAALKR